MGRIHLFEFEDQSWFPEFLRNYITDFLQFLSNKTGIYNAAVPVLSTVLKKSNTNRVVDLASGGGGGLLWINSELKKNIPDIQFILTDLYPNWEAFSYTQSKAANFTYITKPIDARNVPNNLQGLRTLFLALHHFKPEDAKKILQDAVDSGNAIAIFETQERSIQSIIGMLISPISVLLVTPFIRPFKWKRLLFTYLIPIIPIVVLWDGLVSAFRTYSVKEMKELVQNIENSEKFSWEIKRIKSGPAILNYLTGIKKNEYVLPSIN